MIWAKYHTDHFYGAFDHMLDFEDPCLENAITL